MESLFASLKKAVKSDKQPEKRLIRHSREREIIDYALGMLSLSEKGQQLLDFVNEKQIKISVLRGRQSRDYTPQENSVYVSVSEDMPITDPDITIHMAGALRAAMQEFDPNLRKPDIDKGESFFVHRMGEKSDDKLIWQAIIVYELGNFANKPEFIDSFATMGYYSLIQAYEKDLTENS